MNKTYPKCRDCLKLIKGIKHPVHTDNVIVKQEYRDQRCWELLGRPERVKV